MDSVLTLVPKLLEAIGFDVTLPATVTAAFVPMWVGGTLNGGDTLLPTMGTFFCTECILTKGRSHREGHRFQHCRYLIHLRGMFALVVVGGIFLLWRNICLGLGVSIWRVGPGSRC